MSFYNFLNSLFTGKHLIANYAKVVYILSKVNKFKMKICFFEKFIKICNNFHVLHKVILCQIVIQLLYHGILELCDFWWYVFYITEKKIIDHSFMAFPFPKCNYFLNQLSYFCDKFIFCLYLLCSVWLNHIFIIAVSKCLIKFIKCC